MLMKNIIIGNILAIVANILLAVSCCANSPKKVYGIQIIENIVLAVADAFLGSFSGISTLLICSVRNFLLVKEKFNKKCMVITSLAVLFVGLYVNNRGFIGLLPISATIILTVCTYYAKQLFAIKAALLLNITLWMIHDIAVYDFASVIFGFATAIVCIISMIKAKKQASH